jgi:aspartate ammonia-lyase
MQSSALATVFVPKLGYAEVSKLVQASVNEGRPFINLAIERELLTHDEVLSVIRESTYYREKIA